MKESWRYYDLLRRWGILLLSGLVLGGLAGFGFFVQQHNAPLYTAKALVTVLTEGSPGIWLPRANFNVTSIDYSDSRASVRAIMSNTEWLDGQPGYDVVVGDLTIESRFWSPLWKTIVLGSLFGGLLVIGAAYVWDDARAYMRHRRETNSEDA